MHRGQFNVCTREVRKGSIKVTWSELNIRPCHVHGIDDLDDNGLYNLSINGLDVISINYFPLDLRGLHEFSVADLKRLSVNVCPRYVRESV